MNKTYRISELIPFINWLYFYHAWGLSGKPKADKEKIKQEALQMLASWEEKYHTHAIFKLFEVGSEGDDLIFFLPSTSEENGISGTSGGNGTPGTSGIESNGIEEKKEKNLRFPMLRQQHPDLADPDVYLQLIPFFLSVTKGIDFLQHIQHLRLPWDAAMQYQVRDPRLEKWCHKMLINIRLLRGNHPGIKKNVGQNGGFLGLKGMHHTGIDENSISLLHWKRHSADTHLGLSLPHGGELKFLVPMAGYQSVLKLLNIFYIISEGEPGSAVGDYLSQVPIRENFWL